MSERILFGDKITIVVQRGGSGLLRLLPCTVDGRLDNRIYCTNWPGLYGHVCSGDEGVTWARGHFTTESTQGRALMAAVALLELRENIPVHSVPEDWTPVWAT